MRKIISATVSAALCVLSVTPALAQDYRFSGFDAPRGATATLNLRVPLGNARQTRERMSYGLTLGYGQTVGAPTFDGRPMTRSVNIADIRFNNRGELRNARLASFDLANLDRDRRMNFVSDNKNWLLVVAALIAGAACLAAGCFGGSDSDSEESESPGTTG